jgi:ketosteroid isomerase-like protein
MKRTFSFGILLILSLSVFNGFLSRAELRAQAIPQATPSAPAASTGTDQDVQEINALRLRMVDAFNKGDIDALIGSLSPDVVVIWQSGEVNQGPEAVRQYYNRMIKGPDSVVKSVSFSPAVEGRHFYGSTAVSYGSLNDHLTLRDGRDLPFNSRWSASLEKTSSGKWLLTSFHVSANIFENPLTRMVAHRIGMWAAAGGLVIGFIAGALIFRRRKA